MRTLWSRLICLYPDDNVPTRTLSESGQEARRSLLNKIDSGNIQLSKLGCLCGSFDSTLISKKDKYALPLNFWLCENCGLVRIDPYYAEEFLPLLYSGPIYRRIKDLSPETTFEAEEKTGETIMSLLERKGIYQKVNEVIEIGTGAGGILKPMLESGKLVRGYDFNEEYLDYGRQKGLNLIRGDFFAEEQKTNFENSLIIVHHVLEHLRDPVRFIDALFQKISSGCYLYLSVPGTLQYPNKFHSNNLHKCFVFAHPFWYDLNSLKSNLLSGRPAKIIYEDEEIRMLLRKSESPVIFPNDSRYYKILKNFVLLRLREIAYQKASRLKSKLLHLLANQCTLLP